MRQGYPTLSQLPAKLKRPCPLSALSVVGKTKAFYKAKSQASGKSKAFYNAKTEASGEAKAFYNAKTEASGEAKAFYTASLQHLARLQHCQVLDLLAK